MGSGSTGATNVWRCVGKWAGIFVFAIDMDKGYVPTFVAVQLDTGSFTNLPSQWAHFPVPHMMPVLAALAALIGHSRSIFLNFQGGKSAATGLGTLTALNPWDGVLTFGTWLVVLFLTRFVSVASILGVASCGIWMALLGTPSSYVAYCVMGFIWVTARHRANIKRLLNGTEPRIGSKTKIEPPTCHLILISLALLATVKINPVLGKTIVGAHCMRPQYETTPISTEEATNIRIYKTTNRAVVNISTVATAEDLFYNIVPREGMGSGTIISPEGYILTNYHVIEGADSVRVTLYDGNSHRAQVIGSDPTNDLAVLKITPGPNQKFATIPLGDSSKLEVGRRVLAIGNPFGLDRTLTTGIVSSLGRTLKTDNGRLIKGIIQTDAAINPGNSGGPLLDLSGHIVGITTAILSSSGQSAGIGLAIPINIAKRLIPEIIAHHGVIRPDIGIQVVQQTDQGLRVIKLDPHGPAAKAGLSGPKLVVYKDGLFSFESIDSSLADVITSIDNIAVHSADELLSYVEQKKPGQVVILTVLRSGHVLKIPVKLTLVSPA
jgi:acyl-phosphate glycerol 3-phosphate acyltransferase